MTKLTLEVTLPNELLQGFLQHVRDFDTTHDPKHTGLVPFAIGIESDLAAVAIQAIFHNIRPPFEDEYMFQPPGQS